MSDGESDDDARLRAAFDTLRACDAAPPFARVRDAAERSIERARARRRGMITGAGVTALAAAALLAIWSVRPEPSAPPVVITPEAHEPLAFLLAPPSASVLHDDGWEGF